MDISTPANVLDEVMKIKKDMIKLVTLSQSIFDRVAKLETAVTSRKRPASASAVGVDVDSDAFSEDDQAMMLQSKLIKLEREARNNSVINNNNEIVSRDTSKLKASLSSTDSLKPVAVPRQSATIASSSSSSSFSFSSSKPSSVLKQKSAPNSSPFTYEDNRVIVYTDGSCFNNGKPGAKGGIGVYFYDKCPLNVSEPLPGKQSNNRAELQAAVKALMIVRDRKMGPVQIRTDSGYVKQGITNWIKNWKRNGWKTASNNEVKNVDDWKELDGLQSAMDVDWKWVEAHKGIHGNEMADQLANDGAMKNNC